MILIKDCFIKKKLIIYSKNIFCLEKSKKIFSRSTIIFYRETESQFWSLLYLECTEKNHNELVMVVIPSCLTFLLQSNTVTEPSCLCLLSHVRSMRAYLTTISSKRTFCVLKFIQISQKSWTEWIFEHSESNNI